MDVGRFRVPDQLRLDAIADSGHRRSSSASGTRLVRPVDHGLRRIVVRDPMPVYPHSLLWHTDNPHPALTALRNHLVAARPTAQPDGENWMPNWARRSH